MILWRVRYRAPWGRMGQDSYRKRHAGRRKWWGLVREREAVERVSHLPGSEKGPRAVGWRAIQEGLFSHMQVRPKLAFSPVGTRSPLPPGDGMRLGPTLHPMVWKVLTGMGFSDLGDTQCHLVSYIWEWCGAIHFDSQENQPIWKQSKNVQLTGFGSKMKLSERKWNTKQRLILRLIGSWKWKPV